jgi:membrane protease subunit (stomatin/prohibitin family)
MRGRWASAAIGAGIARNRAGREMEAQEAAHQREMDQMRQQYEQQAQQQAQSRPQQSSGQEDVTQKLQKLADLKKQGILSEEEFQKMKMDLLAKL